MELDEEAFRAAAIAYAGLAGQCIKEAMRVAIETYETKKATKKVDKKE